LEKKLITVGKKKSLMQGYPQVHWLKKIEEIKIYIKM
jgi:hypothetical protein